MANINDHLIKIKAEPRHRSPASLICGFAGGILGIAACVCLRHSNPDVQRWSMIFFICFSMMCTAALFSLLWFKPNVFRLDDPLDPKPQHGKSPAAKRSPRGKAAPEAKKADHEDASVPTQAANQ
jgi:hypothetical protein